MAELKKTKEEIIKKAGELGAEYEIKYIGCAQGSFAAVVDALRWGGLELIPRDMEERLFAGLTGLSGGVGIVGDGSCGAVTGSGLAVGLAVGISREMQEQNPETRRIVYAAVQKAVVDKFREKYNSLICKDIQRKRFGKSWDMTIPERSQEFLREGGTFDINERLPERYFCKTPECTIPLGAMWAVEYILDEFEKGNLKGQFKVL